MNDQETTRLPEILEKYEQELLKDWIREQLSSGVLRPDLIDETALREEAAEFISLFRSALQAGGVVDTSAEAWKEVRDMLSRISRTRGEKGFTPSEVATCIFSFKQPLMYLLQSLLAENPEELVQEIWTATRLLDKLGLYTTEASIQHREQVIRRQQEEIMELSTPVVQLWHGVLAVPLIGTLDSARTQTVMENLLQMIVETKSTIAIMDITGVPTVDTLVAQHLIKTVSAAGLMGAECIISGIRPMIAQSMVDMGLELGGIPTKATLADALALALERSGYVVKGEPGRF
ncbi:MAG: STAS domain-containing protein [Desulfohalobiaceae bacterium]|nr:STAS domain-containing protein [Desulfohalobiaceae bacterium]